MANVREGDKKIVPFSSRLLLRVGRDMKEVVGFFINHVFVGVSSMIMEPQNMFKIEEEKKV